MSVSVTFYWPELSSDLIGREKGNKISREKKRKKERKSGRCEH